MGLNQQSLSFTNILLRVEKTKLAISLISIFLAGISTISTVCQVPVDNLFWDYKRFPSLSLLKCLIVNYIKFLVNFQEKKDCRSSCENVGIERMPQY